MTTVIVEILIVPLIGAAIQVLLTKLASRGFFNLFKKRGLELKHLTEFKFLLLSITAVLSDAEEHQITNPDVKLWIDELKDAVYDAEDLFDEISLSRNQSTKSDFIKKVEHVFSRLKYVAEHKDVLILTRPRAKVASRLPTTSLLSELDVLGRDDDKRAILEFMFPGSGNENENENKGVVHQDGIEVAYGDDGQLNRKEHLASNQNEDKGFADRNGVEAHVEDGAARKGVSYVNGNEVGSDVRQLNSNEIPVLAIVGMPGIGKTTLVQLLFNCRQTKDKFDLKVWVHVSEEFDLLKVTKTIYDSVCPQAAQTADLNTLHVKIHDKLRRKRVLLVLDDVWTQNFDYWDVLMRPFQDVASGSIIILTSRSVSVASANRATHIHNLQPLCNEDCWSLFSRHACRPGIDKEYPEIKERVLKKCGGSPLAAKAFGSLLHTKAEIDEWNRILNNDIRDIPIDKCSMLEVLRLSFYHLPSHLKGCFAYCSIFPKGYQIHKAHLVSQWMAQGLVRQHKNRRREEVGNEYFDELISRSFFQQFGSPDRPYFIMHDLFNDLARDVAGDFSFNYQDGMASDSIEKIRHFSFLAVEYCVPENFNSVKSCNHLRTFLPMKQISSGQVCVLSNSALKSLLKSATHLRVLSLSPYQIPKLDDSISNLKYLRYLDLSHSLVKVLPDSLCSLYNLETLLLLECRHLTVLPTDMKNLINLQHLNIQKTKLEKMPEKFGKLINLQVLTDFVVGDSGSSISELKELTYLGGALSLLNLEKVNKIHAVSANLKGKKHLTELVFRWTTGIDHNIVNEENVFAALQPNSNLKKLAIINYGGDMFQTWLGDGSLSKIVYLCLDGCQNCTTLPSLGQLLSLKELQITNMKKLSSVGSEFCRCATSSIQPFKSLEILKFEDLPSLSAFNIQEELTCLKELHLHNCLSLTESLPKHLPSLNTLYISQCPKLDLKFLDEDHANHWYQGLKHLEVRSSCSSIVFFPIDYFTNLESLKFQGFNYLKYFDRRFSHQLRLEILEIEDCPQLYSFPGAELLSNLQSLSVKNCNKQLIPQVSWGLSNMAKLTSVDIEGQYSSIESFPEDGLLPVTLESLRISEFRNLKSLNHTGLRHLSGLRMLEINSCDQLMSISNAKLPSSIGHLNINECPLLHQSCIKGGEDWDKISHISEITIDGHEINV